MTAIAAPKASIAAVAAAILLLTMPGCRHKHVAPPAAAAARKNINVVLVVDRSGSLAASGSCAPLIEAAASVVNLFTPGRDKVGLVTFAASTYVNFPIASTFQTADPNLAAMLAHIRCAGSTSSAEALWTGYQQLLAVNEAGAVNVILFFTDGAPTGVTFDMPVANSSLCSQYTPGAPAGPDAYSMPADGKGYIRGVYNSFSNVPRWFGILNHVGETGADGFQSITDNDLHPALHSTGCAYSSGWPANMTVTSDFLGVPTKDIHGNAANTAYQPVTLNSYGFIDIANPNNAPAVALNAADSAALNIRNGAKDPVSGRSLDNVIIFSIGLGNAGLPSRPEFLERVSNDPRSSIYDRAKPAGAYVYAASSAELQQAFHTVASEILGTSR
jgi:hypothetical protein